MEIKSVYIFTQVAIVVSIDYSQILRVKELMQNSLNQYMDEINVELISPVLVKETEVSLVNDRFILVYVISSSTASIEDKLELIKEYIDKELSNILKGMSVTSKLSNTSYNKL